MYVCVIINHHTVEITSFLQNALLPRVFPTDAGPDTYHLPTRIPSQIGLQSPSQGQK